MPLKSTMQVRSLKHAIKVFVGERLFGPLLRRWLRERKGSARRLVTVSPKDTARAAYRNVFPSVKSPRCEPEMHCAGDLGRVYLNEIRSAGDPTTGEAGVITAREVDVSFPIGMHRCGGQVFVQALLADYVLANPKYVIDLERLPLRRKRRVVSEAVLLTLPWHHNFYHWMVEILPRLSLCDSFPELQGLPLLVARSSPRFVRESLALTGYLDRALFLDDGAYRFEKLHLPTRLAPASQASPLAVEWLRRKVPALPPSNPVRRLYISRRDAKIRSVTNEAEVEAALADLGFINVVPSEHSLSRQVELFRNADIVVGSHGAAFANLAFAKAGTAIIEFFEPGHFNPAYTRIAAINCLRYGFLVGRKRTLGFSIDVPQLRQMVAEAIQGSSRAVEVGLAAAEAIDSYKGPPL